MTYLFNRIIILPRINRKISPNSFLRLHHLVDLHAFFLATPNNTTIRKQRLHPPPILRVVQYLLHLIAKKINGVAKRFHKTSRYPLISSTYKFVVELQVFDSFSQVHLWKAWMYDKSFTIPRIIIFPIFYHPYVPSCAFWNGSIMMLNLSRLNWISDSELSRLNWNWNSELSRFNWIFIFELS